MRCKKTNGSSWVRTKTGWQKKQSNNLNWFVPSIQDWDKKGVHRPIRAYCKRGAKALKRRTRRRRMATEWPEKAIRFASEETSESCKRERQWRIKCKRHFSSVFRFHPKNTHTYHPTGCKCDFNDSSPVNKNILELDISHSTVFNWQEFLLLAFIIWTQFKEPKLQFTEIALFFDWNNFQICF